MQGLSLIDVPFLAQQTGQTTSTIPSDSMESYSDGQAVTGLNGGTNGVSLYTIDWSSPYSYKDSYLGVYQYDNIESYSDGVQLNGLNGQVAESRGFFTAAYASRFNFKTWWAADDMETYSNNAALNSLNGGTNYGGSWTSVYASR